MLEVACVWSAGSRGARGGGGDGSGGSADRGSKALDLAAQGALKFAKTFDEQLTKATLFSRSLGRTPDPAEQFREQTPALRGAGANGLADPFDNPENAAAVRSGVSQTLLGIDSGFLPLKDLGSLTKEQVDGCLSSALDYADAMQAAADAAN